MKLLALILATMPMLHGLTPRSTSAISLGSTQVVDYAADAFASRSCASLGWQSWQPGSPLASQNYNLVYDYNSASGFGFGMNVAMDRLKPYMAVDEEGDALSEFTPSNLLVGLSAGYRFNSHVMVFGAARYMVNTLSANDYYGAPSFDAGAAGNFLGIMLAAGVKNVGPAVQGKYPLPSFAYGAAAYSASFGRFAADARFKADYYYIYGTMRGGAGVQVDYAVSPLVSAGIRLGASVGEGVPFGSYYSAGPVIRVGIVSLGAAYVLADGPMNRSIAFDIEFKF